MYIFKILVYWFLLSFHFCWKDILYIGWCSGVSGRALAYKAWDTEFKPHYCPKKSGASHQNYNNTYIMVLSYFILSTNFTFSYGFNSLLRERKTEREKKNPSLPPPYTTDRILHIPWWFAGIWKFLIFVVAKATSLDLDFIN